MMLVMMMPPVVRVPAVENVVVGVVLWGEVDVTTVPSLSRFLEQVLERGPRKLVFDLAGVLFLDCAAARTIAGTGCALPGGQRPVLCRPRPVVRRLLSVTGLDAQCVIEPGAPAAPTHGTAAWSPAAALAPLVTAAGDDYGSPFTARHHCDVRRR